MKHNYSNADIRRATVFAGLDVHAADIRLILDALPEPTTDDWQECRFEDIRKGDRVKVVDTHEAGDQTVYEGDVVQVSKGLVMTAHHQLHSVYNSKWYRIPAPLQHPDPAEHKYILDVDGDLWIWSKSQGKYVEPETLVQSAPAEFDEWSPAKVVEDDR